MAEKKKKTEATKALTPREMRQQAWEAMQKSKEKDVREEDTRKEFKRYFIQLKRKLSLDPSLEEILWLHLKSAGFAEKELFDKGIKHFGYEL